jgi:hypothetical protein
MFGSIRHTIMAATALACIGLASPRAWCGSPERFEVAAWVDHFDFSTVFDTEKREGLAQILDHVAETGATTILWRNCGGSTMRYQSRIEAGHNPSQLDKRRIAYGKHLPSWVRYGESQPDIVAEMVKLCKQRGLRPGIHWPFEETHWQVWTIGDFNLEHPQYWGRDAFGQPWWGRTSLAYPPVVEHKLALVDELLERGVEVLFIDFWRTGAWGPGYEYVDPVVAAYRQKYKADPPSDAKDLRWCRHVSDYVTAFLRRLRERLKASGRKVELAVGLPAIAPASDDPMLSAAADWRRWVSEGLIDTLVINFVKWDKSRPLESTEEAYREVLAAVGGRCRVWCPVQQYNFTGHGLPGYQKATGRSNAEVAESLTRLAHRLGTQGISLECVDYNNYDAATRQALRRLTTSECREVVQGPTGTSPAAQAVPRR